MKITDITASGLKGCKSFNHKLAGVTVFTGKNAQGKTARLEAMSLILSGSVPGVASKPSDVHGKLASNEKLAVGMFTDNGSSILRSWAADKKGSVKYLESFNGFPDGFAVAPVLLDPQVFLGLSAKERTKFLFRTLPPPSLDKVGPAALVANIKNIKLAENTEATEAVISDLCAYVNKCWSDCEMNAVPFMTIQEWLGEFVENVRTKVNAAAATVKRMETTNAGLTQLKEDGASFAAAEQNKAAATRVLDEAKRVLNECRTNYKHAQQSLMDAQSVANTWVDETEARTCIAFHEQDIVNAKMVAPAGEQPKPETMPLPRPLSNVALIEWQKASNALSRIGHTVANCKQGIVLIKTAIEQAKHKTHCPTCGHDIKDKQEDIMFSLNGQLLKAQDDLQILEREQQTELKLEEATNKNLESVNGAILKWDSDKATLDANNQSSLREYNTKVVAYNATNTTINNANAAIQRLQASIAGNQAAAAAKGTLPTLQAKCDELLAAGNAAKTAETNAGVDFMTADKNHRQAIADRATAQSQARALAEAAKAKCEVEILKQFAEFLNELMIKVIEMSIQPLLATCNRICDGILLHPLALVDGEIGMKNPAAAAGFVSWKTFSGAERALTFAGLSVALSVGQPFKLVMIDEFGKLSAENKTRMFGRLLDLVRDGFIDQAIIVDPDTAFYRNIGDVKDFTCIEIVRD